jgi:hypothetical protein
LHGATSVWPGWGLKRASQAKGIEMFAENQQPQENKNEDLYRTQQQRQKPVHCMNCDIEILWSPVVVQGKTFCCTGCAADGPCNCDYSDYRSVNISGVIHYLN